MIATELKDPRLGFVTVTRVELAHDLGYARVYVGVLGSEKEREKSLLALQQRRRLRSARARTAAAHPPHARDRLPLRQGARRDRPRRAAPAGGRGARASARGRRGERGVAPPWTASSSSTSRPGPPRTTSSIACAARSAPGASGTRAPSTPSPPGSSRSASAGPPVSRASSRAARRSTSPRCGWGSRPPRTTSRASPWARPWRSRRRPTSWPPRSPRSWARSTRCRPRSRRGTSRAGARTSWRGGARRSRARPRRSRCTPSSSCPATPETRRPGGALLAGHLRPGAGAGPGREAGDRGAPHRPAPHPLGGLRPVAGGGGRRPLRRGRAG